MLKRFFKLWHGETRGLTSAALVIGVASLASRVVGVLRDHLLASRFGAGPELDAYYAAFRVPDLLYNLLILGALSAGFIPVFADYLETRGKEDAWKLAEQVLSVVAASMAILCIALAVFAPVIVPLTVPGFSPELSAMTVMLSRIMFCSPLLLGISAVMGGILQATRRMLAFALAPVFYNLGIIFGVVWLSRYWGLSGVAWGVVLGAFLHALVQTSVVVRLGLRRIPWPSLKHAGVRKILMLMAPRTAGLAVSQLNLVILLGVASTLAAGSVSVFNLANNLQSFPIGLIAISFSVSAFPLMARAASAKHVDVFMKIVRETTSKMLFYLLPVAVLMYVFRTDIVRLVLGAGAFHADDVAVTSLVLRVFVLSLLGQALVPLYARAFYALQDTRTPFVTSVVSEIINLALALVGAKYFGIAGLAISFTAATYVNALMLWIALRRRFAQVPDAESRRSLIGLAISTLVSAGIGYVFVRYAMPMVPRGVIATVAGVGVGSVCVGGTYLALCYAFRVPELQECARALRSRLSPPAPGVSADEARGV